MGMKLEAIREDRTRGGRSTYQCSYTIPAGLEPRPGPAPAVPALLQVRELAQQYFSNFHIKFVCQGKTCLRSSDQIIF